MIIIIKACICDKESTTSFPTIPQREGIQIRLIFKFFVDAIRKSFLISNEVQEKSFEKGLEM